MSLSYRKSKLFQSITLLFCLSLNTLLFASEVNFSGFASASAGHVTEDKVFFGDYENDWSFHSDTVLGLQLHSSLAERLSFTSQVIAKGHSYDDEVSRYKPQLDWLFLSYEMSPNLRTRVGRMRTPFYMYSEMMEVGYTYVWVRPPIDVYTPLLSPFRNFDGLDFTYSRDVQLFGVDTEFEGQLFGGVMQAKFLDNDIEVQPALGFSLRAEAQEMALRYSFIGLNTSVSNDVVEPLIQGLRAASAIAPSLAETSTGFAADDQWYQYHGFGISYEPNTWSLVAEHYYIFGSGKELSNDARGYYVSLAKQFGDWTPYVVVGRYKSRLDNDILRSLNNSYREVPEGLDPALDALRNQTRFVIESFNAREESYSVGLRWDVIPNVALKAEYQNSHFSDDSSGQFLPFDDTDKASHATLMTFVIDVVF
jgi:opacity protein-like surface antigen